jgi:hypothetical protein
VPLRHRHGYAVDLLRGLPTQAGKTRSGVLHPPRRRADTHRKPAHIHRVRAGARSRGVTTTSVSLVDLPVPLTRPDPSGSTRPARLCRGCSHRPRQPPVPATSSFTRPLRRPSDGGLSPPSEQATPRGAIPVLASEGSVHALVLRPREVHQRLAKTPPAVLPSASLTAWAPRSWNFVAQQPGLHVPLPTLRHALTGRRRTARGRRGSLILRRRALPSPPPDRFIPALSNDIRNDIRRGCRWGS